MSCFSQLIFAKGVKTLQWWKQYFLLIGARKNRLDNHMKKNESGLCIHKIKMYWNGLVQNIRANIISLWKASKNFYGLQLGNGSDITANKFFKW